MAYTTAASENYSIERYAFTECKCIEWPLQRTSESRCSNENVKNYNLKCIPR